MKRFEKGDLVQYIGPDYSSAGFILKKGSIVCIDVVPHNIVWGDNIRQVGNQDPFYLCSVLETKPFIATKIYLPSSQLDPMSHPKPKLTGKRKIKW